MISSTVTYEMGLARIADLRHEADQRRRGNVLRRTTDRVRSISGQRGQRRDAPAMLSPRRPAGA